MKYKVWFEEWLTHYVKPSSKQRTFEQYSRAAQIHILPYLGDVELTDLIPFVLQKFITGLTENGNKRTGKGLSPNFVKTILSIVQNSLKTAHLVGYLPEYSANKIKRPKPKEKQVECFSAWEQKKIEEAALSAKKINIAELFCACIRGFASGNYLPLNGGTLILRKAYYPLQKLATTETKTENISKLSTRPKQKIQGGKFRYLRRS